MPIWKGSKICLFTSCYNNMSKSSFHNASALSRIESITLKTTTNFKSWLLLTKESSHKRYKLWLKMLPFFPGLTFWIFINFGNVHISCMTKKWKALNLCWEKIAHQVRLVPEYCQSIVKIVSRYCPSSAQAVSQYCSSSVKVLHK